MTLPTISTGSNFANVDLGNGIKLHFSYSTLIGFTCEGNTFVRENAWGATTGKHMNALDGGSKTAKAARLSQAMLQYTMEMVMRNMCK